MVDDLLARYKLIGMNRKEIDELLGMPIPTDYMANYEYAYCLGPERASFLPIDSEWLCLKFKNQVVVEVRLLSD
jgi:hypothetical protein